MLNEFDNVQHGAYIHARPVEEYVLEKVTLNQFIDNKVSSLDERMMLKLKYLDGWTTDLISELTGLSQHKVSSTIKRLTPIIRQALTEANAN